MSSDGETRKLSDLRVVDLRSELEKRGLDKTGNKQILLERLQKALKHEDSETYQFGKMSTKQLSTSANEVDVKDRHIDDDADEENCDNIENIGVNVKNQRNGVTEGGKSSHTVMDKRTTVEHQMDLKIDVSAESDHLIQLTLEEGESFQDEEIDDVNKVEIKTEHSRKEDTKNTSNKSQDAAKELADNSQKTQDKKQEGNPSTIGTSDTKTTTKIKRDYSQSRNLWITNIAQTTRATELKQALSTYGKVIGAKVVMNAKYPGACCYGYVTMDNVEDADNCIAKLNNTELNGHIIRIEKITPDHMNSVKLTQKLRTDASKDKDKNKSLNISKSSPSKLRDVKESLKKEPKLESDEPKKDERKNDAPKTDSLPKRSEIIRESRSRGRSNDKGHRNSPKSIHSRHDREILTFDKIKEEREKQRFRERERVLREETRRRREEEARQRDIERMQRSEAARLDREREKLRIEREKLERDKADIIRLERERQRLEREKIELEKIELQKAKMRLQEDRRTLKRPSSYRREESYEDRKRMTTDRRYEESPQLRFDPPGVKAGSPSKKFSSSSKDFKSRVVYDKRDSYTKRDRDYESERSHPQSSISRGPPTTITKYEGSSVFNIGRERDVHDSNRSRDTQAGASASRLSTKDSRYNERDREHYRSLRNERDRRSIPEQKSDVRSSRDHRYTETSKESQRFDRSSGGAGGGWGHPSTSKFNQTSSSVMHSKSWSKDSWRPVEPSNTDRWNSSSLSRGNPISSGNFTNNSMNLGSSCSTPINNYGGDRFEYKTMSNIRKY